MYVRMYVCLTAIHVCTYVCIYVRMYVCIDVRSVNSKLESESNSAAHLWRDAVFQLELQAVLSMMATEAVQVLTFVDMIVGGKKDVSTGVDKSLTESNEAMELLNANAKLVAELTLGLLDSSFQAEESGVCGW
jgi:hypothetical protein